MIFVNSKAAAENLIQIFKEISEKLQRHLECRVLTGDLPDKERQQIMNGFRCGNFTALISTNVLARGVDVPEVDIVINYDIPEIFEHGYKEPDYETYLHRIGRTGRFQTAGLALTLFRTEGNTGEIETSFINKIEKRY